MVSSFMWLFCALGVFIKEYKADDGIDLNVFHQHDYEVKFERIELERQNISLGEMKIVTFKYNRTIAVSNITFIPKLDTGYELMAIIQVYKFMSNEYRYYPIRFSINACKAMAANVAGMNRFMSCGNFTGCPYKKGSKQHICNFHPDPAKLPPLIPNGQYKVEIQMLFHNQELVVGNVYGSVDRPIVYKDVPTRKG